MAILAQDNFNRANSTTTMGSTQTGQQWRTDVPQTWGIQNNMARPVSPSYDNPMYIDVGQSDNVAYQVTLSVLHDTSQIMWRYVSAGNFFFLEGNVIYKMTNGNYEQIGTHLSVSAGIVFRVEIEGSQHRIYTGGVLRQTITDNSHLNGTKFGFTTNSTTSRFDNFLVESLVVADTTPPAEVTSLTESHTTNSVTLNWVNPTDSDFSHVRILRDGVQVANNITGTTFTDSDLNSSTNYTYAIHTLDTTGNQSAGRSIIATTDDEPPVNNEPPYVYIRGISRTKISDEEGVDRTTLRFIFNQDVVEWRVNYNGVSHDTGEVVEMSVGSFPAYQDIQAVVEWTDLSQEGENRLNIYGRNPQGLWTPYGSGALVDGGSFANRTVTIVFDGGDFFSEAEGLIDGGDF